VTLRSGFTRAILAGAKPLDAPLRGKGTAMRHRDAAHRILS
jgi:hypothetical protein